MKCATCNVPRARCNGVTMVNNACENECWYLSGAVHLLDLRAVLLGILLASDARADRPARYADSYVYDPLIANARLLYWRY